MSDIFNIIQALRALRAQKNIKPKEQVSAIIIPGSDAAHANIECNLHLISGLTKAETAFDTDTKKYNSSNYALATTNITDIYVDTSMFSHDAEIERLKLEIADKKEYMRILDLKLTDTKFIKNAPERVVRDAQDKKNLTLSQLEKLTQQLDTLS